jgi:hypothetical protein
LAQKERLSCGGGDEKSEDSLIFFSLAYLLAQPLMDSFISDSSGEQDKLFY